MKKKRFTEQQIIGFLKVNRPGFSGDFRVDKHILQEVIAKKL